MDFTRHKMLVSSNLYVPLEVVAIVLVVVLLVASNNPPRSRYINEYFLLGSDDGVRTPKLFIHIVSTSIKSIKRGEISLNQDVCMQPILMTILYCHNFNTV